MQNQKFYVVIWHASKLMAQDDKNKKHELYLDMFLTSLCALPMDSELVSMSSNFLLMSRDPKHHLYLSPCHTCRGFCSTQFLTSPIVKSMLTFSSITFATTLSHGETRQCL